MLKKIILLLGFPSVYASNTTALSAWFTALQGTSPTAIVIGDSISQGLLAVPETSGFVYLLSQKLALTYGQHGNNFNSAGLVTTQRDVWTLTGSWTGLAGYGPAQGATYSVHFANGSFNTATNLAVCNSYDVYYLTNTDTGSGFHVAVNDVDQGVFGAATSATPTFAKVNIPTGTLNSYTIKITAPVAGNVYLFGGSPITGSQGITIDNVAASGFDTTGWDSAHTLDFMALITHQLTIVELGTNDYKNGTVVATFQSNLDSIVASVSSYGGSILILDTEQLNPAVYSADRTPYYTAAQAVATKYGAAYLNIFSHWGSYATANANGWMGDDIHPSNLGHQNIETWLYSNLVQGVGSNQVRGAVTMRGAATIR